MKPTVIILSLEDAVARRAPLINAFQAHGVPYEIWHAIDGRKGLPPEHESLIDRPAARHNLGRDMGNAEFACALSHHFIYRDILKRGLEMAVILEDDAIVDGEFFTFLNMVQKPACDLLLLHHHNALVRRTGRLRLENGNVAYRCISTPTMANGYIITQEGAQKLANRSLPIAAPADWPIDIAKMLTYAVEPRLVDHPPMESAPSDIRHERHQLGQLVAQPRQRPSSKRFLRLSYWHNAFQKRLGKRVS